MWIKSPYPWVEAVWVDEDINGVGYTTLTLLSCYYEIINASWVGVYLGKWCTIVTEGDIWVSIYYLG
jgi:hypothetical protein